MSDGKLLHGNLPHNSDAATMGERCRGWSQVVLPGALGGLPDVAARPPDKRRGGRHSERDRLVNLRRLTCNAPAYLRIIERYAAMTHIDTDRSLLRGVMIRLLFEQRQELKQRFKQHITP